MHLEGRRQLTYAFIRSIPFRTVSELCQMKYVSARRQADYQALVAGTKVVVQPLCGHTYI